MLSGLTMSYFTGKSDDLKIPFTTGSVVMEITDFPEIGDGEENKWAPGESNAKNLEWSFKNVGTQPAWLKLSIEGNWNNDMLDDGIVVFEQKLNDWKNHDGYYLYEKQVQPGDTAYIQFNAWLDLNKDNYRDEYSSAKYTITITLNASQEKWD